MATCYWPVWTVILSIAVSYLWRKNTPTAGKLPPGPRGLPILGSLLLLGKNVHHDLHKLAQKYGPVMHLRLGLVPTFVVSSPEVAEHFLKTHDLVFASRPPVAELWYKSREKLGIAFSPHGAYWKNIRKICTLELLSSHKVRSFESMRREEVGLMVESLRRMAREGVPVNVTSKLTELSADITCRMVLGKKYMNEEFHEKGFSALVQEAFQLMATPNLGDFIPYVGALDLQGLKKRMKTVREAFDAFLEKIIEEHMQNPKTEGETKDFVDVMLSFLGSENADCCISRDHVKSTIMDMLAGSIDTSSTTVEWIMSELLKNPRVMKKVQEELENIVGLDRTVEESDLESLHYLGMVTKETLRLHPPGPLVVRHNATEDCTVDGYSIPRKSRIIINVWAMGRDPGSWPDPEKFWPERFEGRDVDIRGRDFQFLPFGSGRRGCPGLQLGWITIRLILAQLLHCFDWELPSGMSLSDLDMTEVFGLSTPRANHLLAIPSYRLRA